MRADRGGGACETTNVAIVGGGLAGMVAALRLAERGCEVSLFEATDRLGGKAGADKTRDDYHEHGYHIFPAWYLNTWQLVDELNVRDRFLDCAELAQLSAGDFPKVKTLTNVTSPRYFWKNLTSGIMPINEMFLFYYSILDLMNERYSRRAILDQVSLTGFLRSRWYRTDRLAQMSQELILKGISVPSYRVSAMTMQILMRYWARYPAPIFRMLRGNLQECFVTPIRRRLEELGVSIYTGERLTKVIIHDRRVVRLQFENFASEIHETSVDTLVMAIPAEKLAALIDDDVFAAAPKLANVKYLDTEPMAALDLWLGRRLEGIPQGLVNLVDSKFGLSFVDVSQFWGGFNTTALNVIAADFTPLKGLSEAAIVRVIVEEIRRYLPDVQWNDIRAAHLQTHVAQPLFMNDVGVWQFRLEPTTELPNLYVAGDHCRTHVDLVSMEGAITSGLRAAEAVRSAAGIGDRVTILRPQVHPRWMLVLAELALAPIAALAKIIYEVTNN